MAKEIERRFLVAKDHWRAQVSRSRVLRQGYLVTEERMSMRVRCSDDAAWITLKGKAVGAVRTEYEYPIPVADGEAILDEFCPQLRIDKCRYDVPVGAHQFEVDVFEGANAGLVIAEVELADEHEQFEHPDWLGSEVTGEPRYLNARLAGHPFAEWTDAERTRSGMN